MEWQLKQFNELTNDELYRILKERVNIFVVEQNCPYPELDDFDQVSAHLFLEDNGAVIAYCRILPQHTKYENASIGRVIVQHKYRRKGIATQLMEKALDYSWDKLNVSEVKIQAQNYLREFYAMFRFKPISDVYMEDGIPHVDMLVKKDKSC